MSGVRAFLRGASRYSGSLLVYVAVGGASALVEWAVFYLALQAMAYVAAALAGFAVATMVNYGLSRHFAFVRRDSSTTEEMFKTYLVSGFALGVNLAVMIALVELVSLAPLPAKIAGTGCAFLFNFAGRQFWVFASTPRHRLPWENRDQAP